MQSTNEEVVDYLVRNGFSKVRDLGDSIKFNVETLNSIDIQTLADFPFPLKIEIKRSGTGLVVIISNL